MLSDAAEQQPTVDRICTDSGRNRTAAVLDVHALHNSVEQLGQQVLTQMLTSVHCRHSRGDNSVSSDHNRQRTLSPVEIVLLRGT